VSGEGFSNGCALFALKKPPPLVPSSLIDSCEATAPSRALASRPRASRSRCRREILDHARRHEGKRGHEGDRKQH